MQPIIFQTQFFTLYSLWLFFAIGIVVTTYYLIHLSIKNRMKIQFLSENSWSIILVALLGARIVSVLTNFNIYFYKISFDSFFNLFAIWDKGLSIWGAIIAGLLYLHYLCQKEDQDFYKWLDVIIPSIILGLAIGHLGNFFDGAAYGRETSLPWGVNFENPSIKYAVPIHPTQIYAFIYSLTLFIVSTHISKPAKDGIIGLGAITVYAFFRFLEEFVRGDDIWMLGNIRISQIAALIITIISATLLYKRFKK